MLRLFRFRRTTYSWHSVDSRETSCSCVKKSVLVFEAKLVRFWIMCPPPLHHTHISMLLVTVNTVICMYACMNVCMCVHVYMYWYDSYFYFISLNENSQQLDFHTGILYPVMKEKSTRTEDWLTRKLAQLSQHDSPHYCAADRRHPPSCTNPIIAKMKYKKPLFYGRRRFFLHFGFRYINTNKDIIILSLTFPC
jgi:hypothetical protein